MYIQAKEARRTDSNRMALRLEELAAKLQTARYDVRDTSRALSECSEQLVATRHSLNTAERKLENARKIPNEISRGKADKAGEKVVKETPGICSIVCSKLEEIRANQRTQDMMIRNCSSRLDRSLEDERVAVAAAEKCSHERSRLQRQLETHAEHFPPNPADKTKLNGDKQQSSNVAEDSKNEIEVFRAADRGKISLILFICFSVVRVWLSG